MCHARFTFRDFQRYLYFCWKQGKLLLSLDALKRGRTLRARGDVEEKSPCWAFATFDGHAGAACSQYLKENFLVR